MGIESYLEQTRGIVDGVIRSYLPERWDSRYGEWAFGRKGLDLEALNRSFAEPVWDFLGRGGKRWRPGLFLLITEALGGQVEKVKDFCILPELAHNGSIIIDDIEDRAELRRGKPCLHKLFGEDTAINAGNFLYFLPLLVFQKNGEVGKEALLRAYQIYAEEMIAIHLGQGMDICWHKGQGEPTEAAYLQMVALKTGCLAREAGRLAVALAGGSQELEQKLGKVCESIGVAFQIADDCLSVSGEEFQKGKGFGDDITEGKRSLPVMYTLQKAPAHEKQRLLEILGLHTTDPATIREALELIKKHGGVEYARGVSRKVTEEAWKEAEPLLKESQSKALLREFCGFATERKV